MKKQELADDMCVAAVNVDFFRKNVNAKDGQVQIFIVAGRGKVSNYGYILDGTPVIHTPFAYTDEFMVTVQVYDGGVVGKGSSKFKDDILKTVSKYELLEVKELAEVIKKIKNEKGMLKIRELKRLEKLVEKVGVLDIQKRWEEKNMPDELIKLSENYSCTDKNQE